MVGLIVSLLWLGTAVPFPDGLPAEAVLGLQRHAAQLEGATLEWTHSIEILDGRRPVPGPNGDLRLDPDVVRASRSRLTFRDGAYRLADTWWAHRKRTDEVGAGTLAEHVSEKAFDGELYTRRVPAPRDLDSKKECFIVEPMDLVREREPDIPGYRSHLPTALSIDVPNLMAEHRRGPAESALLRRARDAGGAALPGGTAPDASGLLVVEVRGPDELRRFELDARHGWVARTVHVRSGGGVPLQRIAARDLRPTGPGSWLPFAVDVEHLDPAGDVRAVEHYELLSFEAGEASPADFVVAPDGRGSFVVDASLEEGGGDPALWVMAATPDELDQALAALRRRGLPDRTPAHAALSPGESWPTLLALGLAAASAYLLMNWLVVGAGRRRSAPTAGSEATPAAEEVP